MRAEYAPRIHHSVETGVRTDGPNGLSDAKTGRLVRRWLEPKHGGCARTVVLVRLKESPTRQCDSRSHKPLAA